MYRVFTCRIAQHVLVFEGLLVTVHLVVHEPGTDTPSKNRLTLPRDPDIVVWLYSWSRNSVEEQVVAVSKGYIDDGRECREGAKPVADSQPNF
jgi:hypothetical protein